MAYAAVINLTNTIRRLVKFSWLSDLAYSLDTIDFPYDEIGFLKEVIEKLDGRSRNKRWKAFHEKIREAAHGLEDAIESLLSKLIRVAQSDQSIGNEGPSVYEEEARQGLNSFVETVKKIEEEYVNEFECPLPGEEEDVYDEDEDEDDCGKKPKLVGSNTEVLITKIEDQLKTGYESSELRVVSIVGVSGTGRSIYAWNLFHDTSAPYLHKLRAFVFVAQIYEFKDIIFNILYQIDASNDLTWLDFEGDEELFEYLYTVLKGADYLIVLDDVRETRVWEYLRKVFPDENNGSRVLLTTHLEEVAFSAQSFSIYILPVLHTEESLDIISRVLFPNQEGCPPELRRPGKKIAKNCKGLLDAAVYAEILSKVDPSPWHWNNVAAEIVYSIANDTYDEISEISKMMRDDYSFLHPDYLPQIMTRVLDLPNSSNYVLGMVYILPTYVAITGMAGIGKTAIAREVFNNQWTLRSYDHRVWLTLGPKYQSKRIFVDIVAQLDPEIDNIHTKDDETLVKHMCSILSSKRCFMVLDDVWNKELLSYLMEHLHVVKCEVLFTTRLSGVAWEYLGKYSDKVHDMRLLNEEESWNLLLEGVFGEEFWPRELEKPGKMIAENCEGLPLMIVTVANLLSKADEKTSEYWNEIATRKNSIFKLAYHKISKILYPSYKNLDLEHRACYLYLATFSVRYTIDLYTPIMLYNAEGIVPSGSWNLQNHFDYLEDLRGKSLVLTEAGDRVNTCRLHSVFWQFCVREAGKDKFFHVMICRVDIEDIEKQRRLCVQNNVLFAIKDVYDTMANVSAARSLLCFGPPHPYQVPICLESKFLKVLGALNIRFYKFPVGIFKLVLLRYLALTYNGKLSPSISKLWNLEFLIIERYMSIHFPGYLSYLPVEIWEMKELKHLQVMGSNLPNPPNSSSAILDKLLTILDVRVESVTKSILERIPNLELLGIRIELAPDHASEPSFFFDHISHLKKLDYLRCVIENPELKSVVVVPPSPFSMLQSNLKRLYLSGFGYPWEHMRPVALMPNLKELGLYCYAFQGAEWVMQEGDFKRLVHLTLEDIDLVNWRADDSCHLISLRTLTIEHCFKLKEIPWKSIPRTCKTTLIDCNPSASDKLPQTNCQVICSWIDGGKI